MLTLVGVSIGTGLLVESGSYLQLGGSVALLLAYLLMGSVVAAVMVCPSSITY